MSGFFCGSCGPGQACVHSCGESCFPIGPTGANCGIFCVGKTTNQCFSPARCTSPLPFCVDLPTACLQSQSCSCVPASVCAGHGGCLEVDVGNGVTCAG
jgi:hypothetical protein